MELVSTDGRLIGNEDLATTDSGLSQPRSKIQQEKRKLWIGLYLGTVRKYPVF